jgi:internalin A
LAALSDVKALYFMSNGRSLVSIDEHADIVGRMNQLTVLETHGTDLSDRGLAILTTLKHLEWLTLSREISNSGMQHLAGMSQLKGLGVGLLHNRSAQLSDAGLAPLANLRQLQELQLSGVRFSKEGTQYLALLQQLEQLSVYGELTDDALEPIGRIKSLKILLLDSQQISDIGIAHLSALRNLQDFYLNRSAIDDRGLESLAAIPSLKSVYIGNSKITDDGIPYLLRLPELERIDLSSSQITDAIIETLATLPQLKQINLKGSKVSPEGVGKLKAARPSLNVN